MITIIQVILKKTFKIIKLILKQLSLLRKKGLMCIYIKLGNYLIC